MEKNIDKMKKHHAKEINDLKDKCNHDLLNIMNIYLDIQCADCSSRFMLTGEGEKIHNITYEKFIELISDFKNYQNE